ncbi:MAG TPA: glycosyl hydrolase [Micropruina sp.]|nr:glycosyl hydrolase [Micropruina sp.]
MSRRSRAAGKHRRIGYGAASGVTLDDPEGTMAMYQNDIDTMAAAGQTWTRYGVNFADVVSGGTATTITWYTPGLEMYDQALDYAQAKGMQVCLVLSGAPDYAQGYTFANYRTLTNVYWQFLVNRWANRVALWHFFNESSGSHYQTFESIPFSAVGQNNFPAGYLTELATLIGDGRGLVRAANPGGLVSTSVEGYPMNDDRQAEWEFYLDVVGASLDVISLHLYTDDYAPEIAAMGTRVAAIRNRYQKPVFVTEFGIPTSAFTEAQQGTLVVQQIESLKAGLVRAMILYTHRDLSATYDESINSFGIRLNNGTNKAGYAAITTALGGGTGGGGGGGTVTFRSASSNAAFPSTSFTVPTPTGTATGDLLVAVHVMDEGGTAVAMTASGWTQAGLHSSAGYGFLKVWTRIVSGTPPASYTFGGNAGGGAQVAILAFSGAVATLAVAPTFTEQVTASASHVLPAAAASSGQVQVSAAFTNYQGAGGVVSWVVGASGLTERVDRNDTYSSLWVGTQSGPTTGTKTITASRSIDYITVSFAVAAA